jgi:hypothetical protein
MTGFVKGGVGLYGELLRTEMAVRIETVEALLAATSTDAEKARLREEILRVQAEYKKLHGLKFCL